MKKTVQIVTIPLDKKDNAPFFKKDDLVLRKVLGGPNLQAMLKFKIIDKNQIALARLQQLLVLSDDKIKEGDWFYKLDMKMVFIAEYTPYKGCKKIIASYPQLEGTLPISKETVQAWIDSGTPGESDIEVQLMGSSMNTNMYFSIGDTLYTYNIDPQGNLLLEFQFSREQLLNKQEEAQSKMWDETNFSHKPSIPTDEKINDIASDYAVEKCRIMKNMKCLTARKTAYIDGYKQALKDLGHE